MSLPHSPNQNHLLAALPAAEFERLAPHLELVPMLLGESLYEPGGQLQHVYFPTTAIVSLLYVLESGSSAEIAGVGNEGIVGISLFMGGDTTPSSAVVQTAGHGYRLPGRLLKEEFNRAGLMQRLLLRYTQALLTQMCQTAACNRHHSIEQQLCRWLLLTLDRLPSNELVMTQELVASALGVRREGITEAAGKLQRAGVIRYRRGHITVLERSGLEAGACECYAVVKKEMARLLSDVRYRQSPLLSPCSAGSQLLRGHPLRVHAPWPFHEIVGRRQRARADRCQASAASVSGPELLDMEIEGGGSAAVYAEHELGEPVDEQQRVGALPRLVRQAVIRTLDQSIRQRAGADARLAIVDDDLMRDHGVVLRLHDQHVAGECPARAQRLAFLRTHRLPTILLEVLLASQTQLRQLPFRVLVQAPARAARAT